MAAREWHGRLAAVAACAWLAAAAAPALAQTEAGQPEVRVVRAPDTARLEDPDAPFWANVPEAQLPTLPQVVVAPMRPQPAIGEVRVRASHDGQFLAIRIEWADPAPDIDTVVDRFGDQVAVQFPADPDSEVQPMPMMGHIGAPVRILQWRAVLQHELRHGSPTITDLYPNAVADMYPDRLLSGEEALAYAGGRSLGNPVSRPRVLSPIVSHVAAGWGSLTATFDQEAGGNGVWRDGRWHVVITYPLATAGRTGLRAGRESVVAFAVWDGGEREVGSRKAWTSWIPMHLEP
jgi:DMSO reductase family type II enzyme heme b subunit